MTKQKFTSFLTAHLERKMSRSTYTWCVNALKSSSVVDIPDDASQKLVKILSYLGSKKLSINEENYLMDIISQVFTNEASDFDFYEVYEGSKVQYRMTLDVGQDFTGYIITGRLDSTGELITDGYTLGTSETEQGLTFEDLDFTSDDFLHKIRIQLETPIEGAASGEAEYIVADFFLCLKQRDIDVN